MNSYTRKFTRQERVLNWLINRLDARREKISEREWAKREAQASSH